MTAGFTRYNGGDTVRYGFYWNLAEWEAQIVPKEGAELKGTRADTYIRLPLVALLFLAPLMGAAYAFFLPFIGFAMLVAFLAGKLRTLFTPPAVEATAKDAQKSVAAGHAVEEETRKRAA